MRKPVIALLCLLLSLFTGCGGTYTATVQDSRDFAPRNASGKIVNVRDFGARGDSKDDTAALVAAVRYINSLGDQPVALYFPAGGYWFNPLHGMKTHFGMLLTASNVEIYGDHAIIGLVPSTRLYNEQLHVPKNTTFYWNYFEIRGSHVHAHDMRFNSNFMTSVGGYSGDHGMFWATAFDINGTPDHMQDDNSVRHSWFVNLGGWAVNSAYQTNLTISKNYASHSEGMGCGGQVYGCTITDNVSEDALDAHYFSNGYTHPGTQNQNVVIRGNVAKGNTNGSGIDVTASWDTLVEKNTVSKNANWCVLVGKTWGPYKQDGPVLPSQRVTVRNNTCDHNGWYQGWPMNAEIFVGEQYPEKWTPGDVVSDIKVAKNTIKSQNAQGKGVAIGYGAARVTIDANKMSGCGGSVRCKYPAKPIVRIADIATDTLTITNNRDEKKYPVTYIQLGHGGPYTISGNDMVVH